MEPLKERYFVSRVEIVGGPSGEMFCPKKSALSCLVRVLALGRAVQATQGTDLRWGGHAEMRTHSFSHSAQRGGDQRGALTVFRADLESSPELDAWFKAFPPEWTF